MGRPRTFDEDAAVAAAVEVFWAQGYRATTPAELGEALGLGKGSLYHAFGSKHGLYLRALERYFAEQRSAFLEALHGEGSAAERLRRALGFVLDGRPEPRGCLVTVAAVEAPPEDELTTDFVRRALAEQREVLAGAIVDGRRIGDLPDGPDAPNPHDAADAVIALMNGVRVMQRVGAPPTASLVDAAMRLL